MHHHNAEAQARLQHLPIVHPHTHQPDSGSETIQSRQLAPIDCRSSKLPSLKEFRSWLSSDPDFLHPCSLSVTSQSSSSLTPHFDASARSSNIINLSQILRKPVAMDRVEPDRIQLLLFNDQHEVRHIGWSTPRPKVASIYTPSPSTSIASPTGSTSSNVSTAPSTSRYSDTSSRKSSSSNATSAPPWRPELQFPTLDQQLAMAPMIYGNDLPCEFALTGCNVRFHPRNFEAWVSHSISHFSTINAPLPPHAICTFCDDDQSVFHSEGDAEANWRERMLHIGGHFRELTPETALRPDFFVIQHMRAYGLISQEDYESAMKFTERPSGCDGLVPLGYKTPRMLMKQEKDLQKSHDLGKEDRQRKREKRSKGRATHRSSH